MQNPASQAGGSNQNAPTRRGGGGLFAMRLPMPGGWDLTLGQATIAAGIVFYSLVTPGDFKYKLDVLGFATCHQIHTHSFYIAGHQLPLCARCTGMYLGALATLALLTTLRRRAVRLPARPLAIILGLFFAAMVLDGVNSTLQTFDNGWWVTTNLLRLITGAMSGIAIGFIFYPVFNMSIWHRSAAKRERVLEQPFELVGYMVAAAILVALVLDGGNWLLYPLSVLSIGGMLALLTMANAIIVLIFTRREAVAVNFSMALTPVLFGLLLSLVELTLMAWGRASLAPYMGTAATTLGLPLVAGLP